MPQGPRILTFGCRLNLADSEAIRQHLDRSGTDPDTVVVNTCAVTAEAERQARQAIRRLKRERPEARIVVTGCAAQIAPAAWQAMPEVDRVVGNREKLDAATWSPGASASAVSDILAARDTAAHLVTGFEGRTRAFVEVQQGCDHRCTFCVIPFGRGNSRSVPAGLVVERVRALVDAGYREIVLTGVDLTAWGADLPGTPRFGGLVRRVLRLVPSLPRLRLSSIDVAEIDEELWAAIAEEERLMPHLHLSLQAGSDLILKRMKRRHSRGQAVAFAARARTLRPGLALGADLIAGFPTETEPQFQETLDLVDEAGLAFLHVFPYSSRPGTPAARMPQLDRAVVKERARRLRAAGEAASARLLQSLLGAPVELLVERDDGTGHTGEFAPARAPGATPGTILTGRADRLEDGHLVLAASLRDAA